MKLKIEKIFALFLTLTLFLMSHAVAGNSIWTPFGPLSDKDCGIAVDPQNPHIIYLNYRDGWDIVVYRTMDQGESWVRITDSLPSGYHTCGISMDPSHPNTLYTICWLYPEWELYKSTDYGDHWTAILDSASEKPSASISVDPLHSNVLYCTGNYVKKSIDGGKNWEFAREGIVNCWTGSLVINPFRTNILYVSCGALEPYSGKIYKSTDGAKTWEEKMNGIPIAVDIGDLVLDPTNPDIIYAGALDCEEIYSTVYKSTDGAESWVEVNNGLPRIKDTPTRLAIDPLHPATLYAGFSWQGERVYKTSNGGQTWEDFSNGLPENAEILTLTVAPSSPTVIYTGIAGHGAWSYTDTASGIKDHPFPGHQPHLCTLFQNYPNPFNSKTVIGYQLSVLGSPLPITLEIYNILGVKVKTLVNKEQGKGYYKVYWDGKDTKGNLLASGLYLCRLKLGEFVQVRKIVLLK